MIHAVLVTPYLIAVTTADSIKSITVSLARKDQSSFPVITSSSRFARSSIVDYFSLRSDTAEWGGLSSLVFTNTGSDWIGVSDAGHIIVGHLSAGGLGVNCTSISLVDDESGSTIFAESIATISGSALTEPGKDGLYVRVESGDPIRLYPSIDPSQYQGLVFNQPFEDPLALCPAELKVDVETCPPTRGLQSIESIEAEPGQSTGSILLVCERPSESDGLVHGLACNPSTGDSWQFFIESEPGWNIADLAYCAACEPSQVFFLSYNDTAFSIDTVLASTLVRGGSIVGRPGASMSSRVRLLEARFPHPIQMHSLSVVPEQTSGDKMRVFVASRNEGNETLILSLSLELFESVAETLEGAESDSVSFSLIVLVVLVGLGIMLPIIINRNAKLKTRLQEIFMGQPKYAVKLNPVGAELSPPRTSLLNSPSTVGKRTKRENGETTPLEVVIE